MSVENKFRKTGVCPDCFHLTIDKLKNNCEFITLCNWFVCFSQMYVFVVKYLYSARDRCIQQ